MNNISKPMPHLKSKQQPLRSSFSSVFCTTTCLIMSCLLSLSLLFSQSLQAKTQLFLTVGMDTTEGGYNQDLSDELIDELLDELPDELSDQLAEDFVDEFSNADFNAKAVSYKARFKSDRWQLSYSQSYLRLQSPQGFIYLLEDDEFDDVVIGRIATPERYSREGWSDALVDFRVPLNIFSAPVSSSNRKSYAGAKIKLPFSDEDKQFGSNETDWYFYSGVSQQLKRHRLSLHAEYQQVGGDFDGINKNRSMLTVGDRYFFNPNWAFGLRYSHKTASSDFTEAKRLLSADLARKLSAGRSLNLFYGAGLSDASPDSVMGFRFTQGFN